MLTDFRNSFTIRLRTKRVMKKSSYISPNLKRAPLHYLVKCKCQETTDNLKQNFSFNNKF